MRGLVEISSTRDKLERRSDAKRVTDKLGGQNTARLTLEDLVAEASTRLPPSLNMMAVIKGWEGVKSGDGQRGGLMTVKPALRWF